MAKKKVSKGASVTPCIDSALAHLNEFSADEIRDYVHDVISTAREYDDMPFEQAVKSAQEFVNKEKMNELLYDQNQKAKNIQRFNYLSNLVTNKGYSIIDFLETTRKSGNQNIQSYQKSAKNELSKMFFDDLSKEEIDFLAKPENEMQIWDAHDGLKVDNPMAKKLGEKIKNYIALRNTVLVESGAMNIRELNADRYFKAVHNPSKLMTAGQSLVSTALSLGKAPKNAMELWREEFKTYLDMDKTFKKLKALNEDGSINEAEVNRIMNKTYDNIVSDRGVEFTRSVVTNDREALAKRQRMTYVFKSGRAFAEYNKKFGQGDLFSVITNDINSSAQKAGMARFFGDNPYSMFNDINNLHKESAPLSMYQKSKAQGLFKQITQTNMSVWSPRLASIQSNASALGGVARLGKLVLQSMDDFSRVGGIAQRYGFGFWEPMLEGMTNAFNLLPSAERRAIAKQFHFDLENYRGSLTRFSEAADMGDAMKKLTGLFYKINLTNAHDKSIKTSSIATVMRGLGRLSNKEFSNLPEQTRIQLDRFGIDANMWDALRTKTKKGLFSLDNMDALTNDEVNALWEKSDKTLPKSEYRIHLNNSVHSFFINASENAVLNPLAFEQMIKTGNTQPGTVVGSLVRLFTQFKSYPVSYVRRTWVQGLQELDSGQAKLLYAFNMASSQFMLGYLSMYLLNLASGKSMPDPSKMSTSQKISHYTGMLAGGLGTFLRIVDPEKQNPDLAVNLLATPGLHVLADPVIGALATTSGLATGNYKNAKKTWKDFARYANPIGTVPILEPWMNDLLGQKPHLEPGQQLIFGA